MNTSHRRLLALSILIIAGSAVACLALRTRRETVTFQVDVAKAVALANKARSVDGQIHGGLSALALAADIDRTLGAAIASDEFRALPIAAKFSDDDARHTQSVKAIAAMCAWSVRADPPAIRITVRAPDHATADALASLIAKTIRNHAVDSATSTLCARRELEHRLLRTLEDRATDQQATIGRMRELATFPGPAEPETAARALDEAAKRLVYCEILAREFAGLPAQVEAQRSVAREFDDLNDQCNASASSWTVPPQTLADAGWTKIARMDPTEAAFALENAAAGKDWFARALSTRDRALSLTIDLPEVLSTDWMRSRTKRAKPGGAHQARLLDAAKRELAQRVVLTPIGDGSVLAVGLSGDFSDEDRRVLMDALSRAIVGDLAEQNSTEIVGRREQLDRRLSEVGAELHDITLEFQREAATRTITADRVTDLFKTSDLGHRFTSLIATSNALEVRRNTLSREADTLMLSVRQVKAVY